MQSRSFQRFGRRAAGVAATAALVVSVASCSGSDSSTSDTTAGAADTSDPETSTGDTSGPESTTVESSVPETTVPETTVPDTTVPDTTAPGTTAPEVTPPETTAPTGAPEMTLEVRQFCFDSEQVYIANRIMTETDSEDPAFVAASVMYTRQAIDVATQTAPDEYVAEPTEAGELLAEIDAVFDSYDYDVEAISASPEIAELQPSFERYGEIMANLTAFLQTVCESPLSILDSQATKIEVVLTDAITWEMLPISNVAGDIRLHVPPDWGDWLGSLEVGEVTFLQASPDNAQMDAGWSVPGTTATVYYVEAGVADPSTRLATTIAQQNCTPTATEAYTDAVYTGDLHLYEACDGTNSGAAVLTATDADQSVEIVLEFQFPDGIDDVVLDQVLATFAAGA